MRLLDYECQTTFWSDFSIAERFGAEAIKDTYERTRAEWGGVIELTEQSFQ